MVHIMGVPVRRALLSPHDFLFYLKCSVNWSGYVTMVIFSKTFSPVRPRNKYETKESGFLKSPM